MPPTPGPKSQELEASAVHAMPNEQKQTHTRCAAWTLGVSLVGPRAVHVGMIQLQGL